MENFNFLMIYMLMDFLMILIMILPSNLYYFHPLTMGLLLILYVIIVSFKMIFILNNCWYSYILFLVMIGGLMILFMYFTSLMNNELFYFKLKYNYYQLMKFMLYMYMFTYIMMKNNYLNYMFYLNYYELNQFNFFEMNIELYKNLMMDFSLSLNFYMIMYLFMMMVSVVIICNKFMIPLRQMNLS